MYTIQLILLITDTDHAIYIVTVMMYTVQSA